MHPINQTLSASLALISLAYQMVFPQAAWTKEVLAPEIEALPADGLVTVQGQAVVQSSMPDTPVAAYAQRVLVTAYSSTPDQTDSTPFITANGTHVRDGIIACNFLSFGTRVRFPEIFGDKIFVVEDRMHPRNSHKMDIWFSTRLEALQFGARYLKVEVLET